MSNQITNKSLSLAKIIPVSVRIRLAAAWLITIGFIVFGHSFLNDAMSSTIAALAFFILLFTIVGAAFGVVKEADKLAEKLGEPYGTLILTLSIVSIEVILISAVILGPGENPTIGKDSIFSVMMIIMNLVIGLCILFGGLKFGEQEYNAQGTISYLGMIIMLGGLGMILPNFIEGEGGGMFSGTQAIVLSSLIIILYGIFLVLQMKGYKHLYMQPRSGSMEIPFEERLSVNEGGDGHHVNNEGNKKELWIRSLILILMILPIVLLSHNMAVVVDFGIKAANLPPLLGGVLIAFIVFTPESITAVKAALNNEFQRAINLCHGAFVSTVGLTIPSILIIGLIMGKTVLFGMSPTETILFIITLLLSVMTFLGKRTTPMVGVMHLVLFAVFIMLIFNP
ncbi:Ca2+:H+ antiporter [Elizabethkingia sp. YR214]|uniref:calcium:proton antiporter n=1 Tax=Elizabethkingia sp. YR214 TaxID=2135667 RepID=UPI000D31C8AF|nr:calcium:proton antiporter [Elizabethkingia sp. YR214]PUB26324.1 Ca2+:H+ antiporter [Elizabethkingia sp. YR214]